MARTQKLAARQRQNGTFSRSLRHSSLTAPRVKLFRKGLLCAACLALCTGQVRAATVTWTRLAGDSLWQNPLNWSTGMLPGAGDDVVNSSSDFINHSAGTDIIASFLSSGNGMFTLSGGSITAATPGQHVRGFE